MLLLLPALVIQSGVSVGIVVHLQLDRSDGSQVRLLHQVVREEHCHLPLDWVQSVDDVGQRVACLATVRNHPIHGLPRVPVALHGPDDLEDGLHVLNVLFNELGLATIAFLLLHEPLHSFLLVLANLFVLFPGQLLEDFFFLVGTPLIFAEVLADCLVEGRSLLVPESLKFAVLEGGELEVVFSSTVEVPLLLLAEELHQEIETEFGPLECLNLVLLAGHLQIQVDLVEGEDMFDDLWEQAGNQLKDHILQLRSSLGLLLFAFGLFLLHCNQGLLHCLWRYDDVFEVDIGCVLEGVEFSHRCLDVIAELVGTDALQDAIVLVSEDDVALRVQFKDEVVGKGIAAEGKHHHPFYSYLPHSFESFGA